MVRSFSLLRLPSSSRAGFGFVCKRLSERLEENTGPRFVSCGGGGGKKELGRRDRAQKLLRSLFVLYN